ncbi:MAG: hybrid sensor histidine kinase/response regulator [Verrucomicrobia bacterium]|nr:hybrid sensor histidine kinase/response regulator [Verrucomicrobiota bacterium]
MPPVVVKLSPAKPSGAPSPPGKATPVKVVAKAATVKRPRVLAVDDTPEALRQLRDCLKQSNNECFTCGSGASAIEFLSKELVDLAIVDVSMPGMDGLEVCRAIKQDARTKDIPVILVTGDLKSEATNRGLELGAFDYLSKPVEQNECDARVAAALRYKRLVDELNVQLLAPDEQRRAHLELERKMADFAHGMTTAHFQMRFGQLAAAFLDEIQLPLVHALGNLRGLMVNEQLKDERRLPLVLIHNDFQRINEHLHRLLNLSVYSRSPAVLRPAELVSGVTKLLGPEFAYHGIVLEEQLDPAIQWWGMRSEISRALLYLLQNAIEAHAEKGPVIKTRFEDEREPEPTLEDTGKMPTVRIVMGQRDNAIAIHIRDNGPGVPADIHEKVWDPYFTTKTPPHTGAGLHLARAIIRAVGGDIQLTSPGSDCATQFSILLPINVIEEEESFEETPPTEEAAPSLSEEADAALAAAEAPEDESASRP